MIRADLHPLLAQLCEGDPLWYPLADGRTLWLEEIADEERGGRDWMAFAVVCEQRVREFRSFNRLPGALRALLGDMGLSADLPIPLTPDAWQRIEPALTRQEEANLRAGTAE